MKGGTPLVVTTTCPRCLARVPKLPDGTVAGHVPCIPVKVKAKK